MKGSSVVQGLKSLADKIHPQLPLNVKESQRLLTALTSSFRKHLDAAHPQHLPDDTDRTKASSSSGSVSNISSSGMRSSGSYADQHLASVLTNPLMVKGGKPLDFASAKIELAKNRHKHPVDILEEYHTKGAATLDIAQLCLRTAADDIAHLTIEQKRARLLEHQPGRRVFRWLVESRLLESDVFADYFDLIDQVTYCLLHEGQERTVWTWYNQDITTSKEHEKAKSRSNLRRMHHFDRWRGRLLHAVVEWKLGRFDHDGKTLDTQHVHDALDAFFMACDIRIPRARDGSRHHYWLPLAPAALVLHTELSRPFATSSAQRGDLDIRRYERFASLVSMWSQGMFCEIEKATLDLVHPARPSSTKAYNVATQLFSDPPSPRAKAFLPRIQTALEASSERHGWWFFFVRTVSLLRSEGKISEAAWLTAEMQRRFPKQWRFVEENVEPDLTAKTRTEETSRASDVPKSLRIPFPSFT
ncbi:Hypothetical predicted protein [Lecanosticta acicola]|uniref:Uncharacterized protein n=1 Tax=Lecanosticta acicola TaxID=111012 RepID=A0AAI8YSE2_9PEZI|nr:Hypothetical predicted protein [Lecanosticta acicola]